MTDNPLLDRSGLPRFDRIEASHVTPAVAKLLADARAALEAVASDPRPPTFDNIAAPLDVPLDALDRAWGAVAHLNAVVNTPGLRSAYHANLPAITAFHTDLAQDLRLYERYRALAASDEYGSLEPAKRRHVDNELRDFRLSGALLPEAPKARFKAIQEELAKLAADFDDHVLDETNAWARYVVDETELAGVPAPVRAEARAAANAEGRDGWKLTLRAPCYRPVMQYADRRELRREMHRAYVTRASELGLDPARDNGAIVARILLLRREAAELLGLPDHAALSLARKMAGDSATVLQFLRDLARRARPFAEKDFARLAAFAKDELGIAELASWDLAYASEKEKAARFDFTAQEIRDYFPEHSVLSGLFKIVETLYGIRIREGVAPIWHPSVRYFEIVDRDGAPAGAFYLDSYAREGKQGGAWMDNAINRRRFGGTLQLPVAYLTCNLPAPVDGSPATFTHDEVVTIFHEFGHGLHLLLTRIEVPGVSGLEGVEWDAVELPSQFMENFCWEWDVVRGMTSHVVSGPTYGTPLPRERFDRLREARNFQSGIDMMRQLELGLVDMRLHTDFDPRSGASPMSIRDAVHSEIGVVPLAPCDRFLNAFGHIFAGGYAAGYYSYKWAEVLSADAYSLFEESGVLSPSAGAKFRDEVLSRGGSRTAMESFVAFRGRPPQQDALLRHNGMIAPV